MAGSRRHIKEIVVSVVVALAVASSAPWWWDAFVVDSNGDGGNGSTGQSSPPTPTPTPTPVELGLEGTWEMTSWVEEPGPVQLGFAPLDGELTIDAARAAAWTFRIDDEFADDEGGAASACEGRIDLDDRLQPTRGPDERLWTDNMRSLRIDIGLAFCGRAIDPQRGLVTSPFDLLRDGDVLQMRNEHGTFTWRRS